MRIVVIDGAALNPGDLSWEGLSAIGDWTVFDGTGSDQVVARCAEADAVLTNKVRFDRATFEALPQLRYVGVTATGFDCVDVEAATEHGVVVCNVPAYSTASVAQLAIALMLELTTHVAHHAARVRDGSWTRSGRFSDWDRPMVELQGRSMGIVGLGAIGSAVADVALALGMRVRATGRGALRTAGRRIERVDLDELFRRSDVVSLHCPLTETTRHLVDAERLASMPEGALLINTARGQLVDERALDAALRDGSLGGAGLDVLQQEPPPADHPLLSAPRCMVTSHLGWASAAARQRLMDASVDNLRAYGRGRPRNRVG